MLKFTSKLRAGTAAAAVLAAVAVTAPQAVAAEQPASSASQKSAAAIRAVRANPVTAAATVCGAGYTFKKAIPLPVGTDPRQRLATLFSYENNGKGCAILDNNQGSKQYMYLRLCQVDGSHCDTNSGMFSEYAGPVRVSAFACAPVTAKMGQSSSSLYIDYKSDYLFPCD
ncbi:hypothetical protein [Streptomyces sp. NPDC046197]|uniref:hypothetical protein n=1 Tax=Streptomyces sp. NPDC046197 TaxID=3154337 RepID=UPI0033EEC48C